MRTHAQYSTVVQCSQVGETQKRPMQPANTFDHLIAGLGLSHTIRGPNRNAPES